MLKRHEIQVLRRAGHTLEEVAKLAGVSPSSVQRVEAEPPVMTLDTAGERARRGVGRPSKVEAFRTLLVAELARQPDVLAVELLRRARLAGYRGGKSALYELIAALRPREAPRPLVRFEGLAGGILAARLRRRSTSRFVRRDGPTRVHFFASRLKYSRWAQVSLVDDERVESLVRALVDHFAAMGGVPLVGGVRSAQDRGARLAARRRGHRVESDLRRSRALDLGLGVELCWPYSPRQKGAVENLVGWVKGSFFKQRRFLDEEDLREQLAEWHDEVNCERPSRATGVPPAARMAEERARLRPLKVEPEELALRFPVMVGPTGDGGARGARLLDAAGGDRHRRHALPLPRAGAHRRRPLRGAIHGGSANPAHARRCPSTARRRVAAVSGKRAKRYLEREHLLELGRPALDYLTELIHRRPRLWVRDVDQLHELLQHHGAAPAARAFERGLAERLFGAEYIAHALSRPAPPTRQPPPAGARRYEARRHRPGSPAQAPAPRQRPAHLARSHRSAPRPSSGPSSDFLAILRRRGDRAPQQTRLGTPVASGAASRSSRRSTTSTSPTSPPCAWRCSAPRSRPTSSPRAAASSSSASPAAARPTSRSPSPTARSRTASRRSSSPPPNSSTNSRAAFRNGRLAEALARYTHPHVLVVDEVGYLTYGTDAANMLFHVVNDRHKRKRSMIFTTNKPLAAWGRVLHDDDLAQAIVDRVLERGRLLHLDGPSMRTKHLGLDDSTVAEAPSDQVVRISGIPRSEFPEPTLASGNRSAATRQAVFE